MDYYLGVDVGGTKLDFSLADETGKIVAHERFDSPFLPISEQSEDGPAQFACDVLFDDFPRAERVRLYLEHQEAAFLQHFGSVMNGRKIAAKGVSLCGRTWERKGKIFIMGGNTPLCFAEESGEGKGVLMLDKKAPPPPETAPYFIENFQVEAANDGTAAATAQGVWYKAKRKIPPAKTGYFIVGTGFGFGVPGSSAPLEIGHVPMGFIPDLLWQKCGCSASRKTACAENFASGRGIQSCARKLLSIKDDSQLEEMSRFFNQCNPAILGGEKVNLAELVRTSQLRGKAVNAEAVMELAGGRADGLCVFTANLAAYAVALCAVSAAQLLGLKVIGIGEGVAIKNPWHVENIAKMVQALAKDSVMLPPGFKVELTPVKNISKYAALSLVAPRPFYPSWAEHMEGDAPTTF
ncbi:hypothetical protein Dalk_2708 [Desulfatibacillum aliphaticivorans]|uniref:Glucokinase n=1 Tax=Desulfatibacillum aliphaticivorans TaxID=218208 RepID=B8FJ09_DESAL|nr:ROK family protein [Desulfatibacillum aliphaticivorans]ACL04400.1 hypothetical protein Dalk_2708 [Desulfatibacillum aliphaticivorans]